MISLYCLWADPTADYRWYLVSPTGIPAPQAVSPLENSTPLQLLLNQCARVVALWQHDDEWVVYCSPIRLPQRDTSERPIAATLCAATDSLPSAARVLRTLVASWADTEIIGDRIGRAFSGRSGDLLDLFAAPTLPAKIVVRTSAPDCRRLSTDSLNALRDALDFATEIPVHQSGGSYLVCEDGPNELIDRFAFVLSDAGYSGDTRRPMGAHRLGREASRIAAAAERTLNIFKACQKIGSYILDKLFRR